jgi:broad specificity phosphatase PhoE
MQRAMETAQAIAAAHDLTAHSFDGLLDIDFGEWQGRSPEEVEEDDPKLLKAWFEAPHTVRVPGGESLADVRDRVVSGLHRVIERHPGQTVAMVGHTVVNRVLLCAVLGLGNDHFWRLRQETCAVNVFEAGSDGTFTIVLLNDTCHLQDL